ncbi:MAG: prenyltransferase/squalene oxidase repeat-containing protein [Gemmataceae bacterium]
MRSLAVVLLFPLAAPAQTAEIQDSVDQALATIRYVQALQTKEGGFRPSAKAPAASLRGTSAALRALRYFGGKARDEAAAREFVLSCLDAKTGGFADTPGGKADVILTAVGLMAMVELKLPTETVQKRAVAFMAGNAKEFEQVRMAAAGLETIGKPSPRRDEWLAKLGKMRNEDGTFGKGKGQARETGGAVACLLRLGGAVADRDAVLKALDAGQRTDGGFGTATADGSDLETSYRVMRSYHMLKAQPKRADDLRRFVARCRNADGGYGVTPGTESTVGGTYFASIILHWLGRK